MRISDWSSDVCSSDLGAGLRSKLAGRWRILLMHLLHRRFAEMEKGRKPSLPALFSLIADARRYALQDWVSLPGTVAVTEGPLRSEERRAGKECVSTWRFRGGPNH